MTTDTHLLDPEGWAMPPARALAVPVEPRVAPPLNWLRVRDEATLERIPSFIRKQRVNTASAAHPDRKGNWIIMLGWDDRPDSDWRRFRGNRAALWFATEELATKAEIYVRKGFGWEVADA